jgi:hypothetical protein
MVRIVKGKGISLAFFLYISAGMLIVSEEMQCAEKVRFAGK